MWNSRFFMTRSQMRDYDRIAIDTLGIPGPVLMENAGCGAARIIMDRFDAQTPITVVAGPGNNGGDGFVIARHLINHGYAAVTYLAHPREKITGDARLNLDVLIGMKGPIIDIDTDERFNLASPTFDGAPVLVDALLGTGVSREVKGRLGRVIDRMNACEAVRVAIDIPSGLDADTGRPWGRAVASKMTITFGHIKRGMLLHPGAALCGTLHTVPIGVPGQVSEAAGIDGTILDEATVRAIIPARASDSHKGTFGHLLVVGGFSGKTGAAAMTGNTAMRVGAGLVTIATTVIDRAGLDAKCMETMVDCVAEGPTDENEARIRERIETVLEGKRAVAVGPGLGTGRTASLVLRALIAGGELPMVLDADAINLLASHPDLQKELTMPAVLTPHPGEMARLMGTSIDTVQSDRIGAARTVARNTHAVVVLKGAHTVVAAPSGDLFINPTGNAGMASGGMGDVLTGIIGGLLAQGCPPLEAACAGVYLHGEAADSAAKRTGEAGLVATDVIRDIPIVLKKWTRDG